jgi:hypothetical protein
MAYTAYNEHIGSMAALPPLEKMCEIERLPPAGMCLEAATAPICRALYVIAGQHIEAKKNKREFLPLTEKQKKIFV